MKARLKILWIFIFIAAINSKIIGQTPYQFFSVFLDKGLSDTKVNAIVQDKFGYMWFATANGLNKFDGFSMKVFFASNNREGLLTSNIISLYSDSKGELWVGTDRGLYKYNFVNETFSKISITDGFSEAYIKIIKEDDEGNLFFGAKEGLYYWERKKDKWSNIGSCFSIEKKLKLIRGIEFFKGNSVFVSTEKCGFYKFNIKQNKIDSFTYKTEFGFYRDLHFTDLQKLNDSILLVGTLSFGINKFIEVGTLLPHNNC